MSDAHDEYLAGVRVSDRLWCESDLYWRTNRWSEDGRNQSDDPNRDLITGEFDQLDALAGGDGIVYAGSPAEAQQIRAELKAQGFSLHGIEAPEVQ